MNDVFRALNDETRRLIIDGLVIRDGQTLFEICARLSAVHGIGSSRQAISQHLAVLEDAGLIATERRGRSKFHYFTPEPLGQIAERWPTTKKRDPSMRIQLTGVFVDDQRAAKKFYTEVLGFQTKHDIALGEHAWLTVVAPDDVDGPELLLEPSEHPAVKPYRDAMMADGIPLAQFHVDDVEVEYQRLNALGVEFTMTPTDIDEAVIAVFDDTCGNLVQLFAEKSTVSPT